jgi:Arc/MetJ-type ribon-helix-helix transcriptional regulator
MTIYLTPEIENSIQAAVHSGHFVSVDAAVTEARRAFERHRQLPPQVAGQGLIGALRDDAELLDQIRRARPEGQGGAALAASSW